MGMGVARAPCRGDRRSAGRSGPQPRTITVGRSALQAGGYRIRFQQPQFSDDRVSTGHAILRASALAKPIWIRCEVDHDVEVRVAERVDIGDEYLSTERVAHPDGSGLIELVAEPIDGGPFDHRFVFSTTSSDRFSFGDCTITPLQEGS